MCSMAEAKRTFCSDRSCRRLSSAWASARTLSDSMTSWFAALRRSSCFHARAIRPAEIRITPIMMAVMTAIMAASARQPAKAAASFWVATTTSGYLARR